MTPGVRLWIDVNDLFEYAKYHRRPSGIQRFSCELYSALIGLTPTRIGFLVHGESALSFEVVSHSEVTDLYERLAHQVDHSPEQGTDPPGSDRVGWQLLLQNLVELMRRRETGLTGAIFSKDHNVDNRRLGNLQNYAKPGDVLCSLGAPWWHDPRYGDRVQAMQRSIRMRFALLVYDLIPLVCPEYYDVKIAPNFERAMLQTIPLAYILLTISSWTANDLTQWSTRKSIRLRTSPKSLLVGSRFGSTNKRALPVSLSAERFVLLVSTIEIRKNHWLAFRVWLRLIKEMPWESIPHLVFVGRIGWMVADLMQAIANTNHLGGKLIVLQDVDDDTLSGLYQDCLFTLFPSYYEGWGLPVTDSLAFGKICVASDRTAIKEAGQEFCIYIDPDNTTAAYYKIRWLIENPREVARLETEIRNSYKAVPWSVTASSLLNAVIQDVQA